MNQEVKEINVLQASDGSFIVRSSDERSQPVIKTYKEFPALVEGLQDAFFSVPSIAVAQPTQAQ